MVRRPVQIGLAVAGGWPPHGETRSTYIYESRPPPISIREYLQVCKSWRLWMRGNRFTEAVWALFRGVIGLLFALHGASTVFGVFGGNRGGGHAAPVGTWPGWYAGLIELVCGLLVLVGLLTV